MKNIKYAILLICTLAFASCDKYLVQSPTDRYTDDQVWQDEYLIEGVLAELYACSCFIMNDSPCTFSDKSPVNVEFSQAWDWNGNLGLGAEGEGPIHAITMGDECKYSERGAQTNYHSYKMNGVQHNSSLFRWWKNAYYLNRQLNHFIDCIEDSPVSDAVSLKSEARFIRAFNYFALVKRYGGVPLILKETPIDAPEEELYPYRASEEEIYDFIIEELTDVAKTLPATAVAGRAGKGAALTLLSRVALYAGSIAKYGQPTQQLIDPATNKMVCGMPADRANEYFQTAYDAAKKVMTECPYSLYNGGSDKIQTLRDIFLVKDNCEAIMVRRFDGTKGSNYLWSWDITLSPKPNAWSVGQYALPYYNFIEEFEFKDGRSGKVDRTELTSHPWDMEELFADRDPRLMAWHWTNGSDWPGAIGGEDVLFNIKEGDIKDEYVSSITWIDLLDENGKKVMDRTYEYIKLPYKDAGNGKLEQVDKDYFKIGYDYEFVKYNNKKGEPIKDQYGNEISIPYKKTYVFDENTISMYDGIKHTTDLDTDVFYEMEEKNGSMVRKKDSQGNDIYKLDKNGIFDNVSVPADPEIGAMSYGDQQKEMAGASLIRWRHTGFGIRKGLDPEADNNNWFCCSTSDFHVFRYAEVLLNYAEAALELGKNADALDAVNQIRTRAGISELGSIDMEKYRHERQIELCYENHRYWDLKRWRIAREKLHEVDHEGLRWILDAESFKAGHSKFWIEINQHVDSDAASPKFPESNYYLPIGDGSIALNNHLIENPGY